MTLSWQWINVVIVLLISNDIMTNLKTERTKLRKVVYLNSHQECIWAEARNEILSWKIHEITFMVCNSEDNVCSTEDLYVVHQTEVCVALTLFYFHKNSSDKNLGRKYHFSDILHRRLSALNYRLSYGSCEACFPPIAKYVMNHTTSDDPSTHQLWCQKFSQLTSLGV